MSKKLYELSGSASNFLLEARFCAENGKGFATMCTVFSVILTISEALTTSVVNNNQLILKFVENMVDKKSWWVSTQGASSLTDQELAEKLNNIRNGFAHALSHAPEIILVNRISEVRENTGVPPNKWCLGTVEFVKAVHDTADILIAKYASNVFDSKPEHVRVPSEGSSVPWGSSASGINLYKSSPLPKNFGRKII